MGITERIRSVYYSVSPEEVNSKFLYFIIAHNKNVWKNERVEYTEIKKNFLKEFVKNSGYKTGPCEEQDFQVILLLCKNHVKFM